MCLCSYLLWVLKAGLLRCCKVWHRGKRSLGDAEPGHRRALLELQGPSSTWCKEGCPKSHVSSSACKKPEETSSAHGQPQAKVTNFWLSAEHTNVQALCKFLQVVDSALAKSANCNLGIVTFYKTPFYTLKSNTDINEVVAALFPEKNYSTRTLPVLSLRRGRWGIAGCKNCAFKIEEPLLYDGTWKQCHLQESVKGLTTSVVRLLGGCVGKPGSRIQVFFCTKRATVQATCSYSDSCPENTWVSLRDICWRPFRADKILQGREDRSECGVEVAVGTLLARLKLNVNQNLRVKPKRELQTSSCDIRAQLSSGKSEWKCHISHTSGNLQLHFPWWSLPQSVSALWPHV